MADTVIESPSVKAPIGTDTVVLVDENDVELGLQDKVEAHTGSGALHRAFTVFVFDSEGRTLVAQRAADKMLWPLWWDSACASHPRAGESQEAAGERRLLEELGFTCPLHDVDKFAYHAVFEDAGSEFEVCTTLVGFYDGPVDVNADEVAEYKWMHLGELLEGNDAAREAFAPWFLLALDRLQDLGMVVARRDGTAAVLPTWSTGELLMTCSEMVFPVMQSALSGHLREEHHEPMVYAVQTGGKRLRPFLTIASCLMLGGEVDEALPAAAAIEILHNATLIADDIIDHSVVRRGEPTLWKQYGTSFAECAVLSYCASWGSVISGTQVSSELLPLLASTLKTIVDGELLDIRFERGGRPGERFFEEHRFKSVTAEDYGDMVYAKTAVLFECACRAGAICAGASESERVLAGLFGRYLGMAFQVRDDLLDVFGDQAAFGKEIGRDIYERKVGNIVLLNTAEGLDRRSLREFDEIMSRETLTSDDVDAVMRLIGKTKARALSERLANEFGQKARISLSVLPEAPWKNVLLEIADQTLTRAS